MMEPRIARPVGRLRRSSNRYSSAAFFATTVSPPYVPHAMQTRCGTRGAPQPLQACTVGRFAPDLRLHAERW